MPQQEGGMRQEMDRKVEKNLRLTVEDANYLYREASMEDLRRWATQARARFHPADQATYLTMRIINYTNICVALCDYCSFYRLPKSSEGYVMKREDIFAKIDEILELKGDFVAFNGGFNPKLKLDWYVDTFAAIRAKYGDSVEFFAMTVAEMMYVAKLCRLSYDHVCNALKDAGVRWITGGGAEILTNDFRMRHSPRKYRVEDYYDAQAAILNAGLSSTATMVIGFDESIEERIEHLNTLRDFQDRMANKLFSFLSWTYKPYNNDLGGEEVAPEVYWRHLAVSRLFLDNFKHIRTSVLTQNENALRGLHFGANDFDIPLEDEVTEMAGAVIDRNIEGIVQAARDEGFEPVYRYMAQTPSQVTV
jgi:cyclic dehypoxanthinyl futalosine synthase